MTRNYAAAIQEMKVKTYKMTVRSRNAATKAEYTATIRKERYMSWESSAL
jgi:hypothetical protein